MKRETDYEFNPRATNAVHYPPRRRKFIGRQQKKWLFIILILCLVMFISVIFAAEYNYQFRG